MKLEENTVKLKCLARETELLGIKVMSDRVVYRTQLVNTNKFICMILTYCSLKHLYPWVDYLSQTVNTQQ